MADTESETAFFSRRASPEAARAYLVGSGDWIFANPWPWLASGLLGGLAALALAFGAGVTGEAFRVLFVFAALTLTAAGVTIRLKSSHEPYLAQLPIGLARLIALIPGALGGLVFLTTGVLFFLSVAGVTGVPGHPGILFIIWMVVGNLGLAAAVTAFMQLPRPIRIADESATVLAAASLICCCTCAALYVPAEPLQWDSFRLVLRVLAVVALVGGLLAYVSTVVRRVAISAILLFHFVGIMTATLAAAPAPLMMMQLWTPIYRPYLEFMYLNNAYHFYAPEPGPASYVWFRLIYRDPEQKDVGVWYKIPDIDDKGYARTTLALEYQRFLALTEATIGKDATPSIDVRNSDGTVDLADFYRKRFECTPEAQLMPEVVGKMKKKPAMIVPFNPNDQAINQYWLPGGVARELFASFAEHVCRMPHPQHPEWPIVKVKIYRVIHQISPSNLYMMGWEPDDPEFYHPYYVGDYDPDGKLLPSDDAFLYWQLPVLRSTPMQRDSMIKNYALLHAGDPNWISVVDPTTQKREWVPEGKK